MTKIPTTNTKDPAPTPWIVPTSPRWRIVYGLSTILIPWLGFIFFASRKYGEAEWQDGNFSTYVELAFSNEVWTLFSPFLLYSTIAMLLLLIKPARFARYWIVRLGIYSGTILALHYTVQIAFTDYVAAYPLALMWVATFIALLVGVTILWPLLYLLVIHRIPRKWVWYAASVIVFLFAAVALISPEPVFTMIGSVIFLALLGFLSAGVVLCAPLALWTTICLLRNRALWTGSPKWILTAAFGWIVGYGVAWYAAVQRILELYAEMPQQPPDCYIATASAHGHPQFVRPFFSQSQTGQRITASRQLQIMKAGELILSVTAPNIHRLVRKGYNVGGQWLARRIDNRWSATVSYLLIKPFEWTMLLFLKLFVSRQLPTIYKFYKF